MASKYLYALRMLHKFFATLEILFIMREAILKEHDSSTLAERLSTYKNQVDRQTEYIMSKQREEEEEDDEVPESSSSSSSTVLDVVFKRLKTCWKWILKDLQKDDVNRPQAFRFSVLDPFLHHNEDDDDDDDDNEKPESSHDPPEGVENVAESFTVGDHECYIHIDDMKQAVGNKDVQDNPQDDDVVDNVQEAAREEDVAQLGGVEQNARC
ncbi:hypothetical protein QVD17_31735 [Tagetes erecta]|uniref:Uncharacterized protein n=1 Tax=Tagetes erecta TaxID=13708 RepID=A0AAD8K8C0_TARER|nr:hypothetical protein QVD17_31735 [Tagetes erecta]